MKTTRALILSTILLGAVSTGSAADRTLQARFELAPGTQWATVTIPFDPSAWRGAAGDVTAEGLRNALAAADRVEVAVRCAGWVEGATSYPCGLEVVRLDGGAPQHPVLAFGMQATPEGRVRTAGRSDTPELRAAGLIAPLPDAAQRVAVALSARGLEPAQPLRFRVRALPNRMVPSDVERSSGEVVLRVADDQRSARR